MFNTVTTLTYPDGHLFSNTSKYLNFILARYSIETDSTNFVNRIANACNRYSSREWTGHGVSKMVGVVEVSISSSSSLYLVFERTNETDTTTFRIVGVVANKGITVGSSNAIQNTSNAVTVFTYLNKSPTFDYLQSISMHIVNYNTILFYHSTGVGTNTQVVGFDNRYVWALCDNRQIVVDSNSRSTLEGSTTYNLDSDKIVELNNYITTPQYGVIPTDYVYRDIAKHTEPYLNEPSIKNRFFKNYIYNPSLTTYLFGTANSGRYCATIGDMMFFRLPRNVIGVFR